MGKTRGTCSVGEGALWHIWERACVDGCKALPIWSSVSKSAVASHSGRNMTFIMLWKHRGIGVVPGTALVESFERNL